MDRVRPNSARSGEHQQQTPNEITLLDEGVRATICARFDFFYNPAPTGSANSFGANLGKNESPATERR